MSTRTRGYVDRLVSGALITEPLPVVSFAHPLLHVRRRSFSTAHGFRVPMSSAPEANVASSDSLNPQTTVARLATHLTHSPDGSKGFWSSSQRGVIGWRSPVIFLLLSAKPTKIALQQTLKYYTRQASALSWRQGSPLPGYNVAAIPVGDRALRSE